MNEDRDRLPDDLFGDGGDMDEKFEEALDALESYPYADDDAPEPDEAEPEPAPEPEPDIDTPEEPAEDWPAEMDEEPVADVPAGDPASDRAPEDEFAAEAEPYDAEPDEHDWPATEPEQLAADEAASAATAAEAVPAALGEPERLRQPRRAESFRRQMRAQFGMMPLALFLVALGLYLIMRQQAVDGLPDFSDAALVGAAGLAVAFTAVFHAFVFGRTERGLLFFGLLVWISAGLLALLVLGIERDPQAAEWWPLVLVALGLGLFVTFLVERARDARLVLASAALWVAAAVAFVYTNGQLDDQTLNDAADYWPLLLSVVGVGLLPLAFRRRTG